ncbi:MAG: intradiol ring-cleavage dioxygenase [Acidobacteriota bacterium]
MSRRMFIAAGVTLATTYQLQRAAGALGLSSTAEVCQLIAEQEIGPYYIDKEAIRSDISEGKPGVPLELRIALLDAATCEPLANAAIDVWHCDAMGLYSGFTASNPTDGEGPDRGRGPGGPPPGFDPNRGGPGRSGGPMNAPTDKLTFLRGIQITSAEGIVTFKTVFPGFYMGRTNHIHFKVRMAGRVDGQTYAEGHTSHVGQVFFTEDVNTRLMQHPPYNLHKIHRTTNQEDGIYNDQSGRLSTASLEVATGTELVNGARASIVAALDPAATPAPVRGGGPGRGGPGRGGPGRGGEAPD